MQAVARRMASIEEMKLFEDIQIDVAGKIDDLLLGETRCSIVATISQVQGSPALVSDLKKSSRNPTSWSRQKLREVWRNRARLFGIPPQRSPHMAQDTAQISEL